MDIIMWFVGLGWKLLLISVGFWLCWLMLTKGNGKLKEVLTDIFRTLGLIMEAVGCAIRKRLMGYIRKEKGEPEGDPETAEEKS